MLMIWDDYFDEFAPKYHDIYIDFRKKKSSKNPKKLFSFQKRA